MYKLLPLAILPSILLGTYIYIKDKEEKESLKLLTKLFISGIVACFLSVLLTYALNFLTSINIFDVDYNNIKEVLIHAFITVALIEETSKWLFTYFLTKNNKEYNYSFDIIIYSAFVSLGFATFENILYILASRRLDVAIIRLFTTVPGHLFFSIFMGYFLLKLRTLKNTNQNLKKQLYKILSIIVPTLLHGFFDFCIMIKSINLIIIFIFFLGFLYVTSYFFVETLSDEDVKLE